MKKHNPFLGKTVAILAPGSSITSLKLQNHQFDVICAVGNWFRFRGILIPKITPQVDIVYPGPGLLRKLYYCIFQPSYFPEIRTAQELNIRIAPEIEKQTSYYNFNFDQLADEVGCNLTTGMCAILDVFHGNPQSISLFGFDFYQSDTPYCPLYTSKFETKLIIATRGNLSGHNQHLLLSYFAKHIYPHVSVEPHLANHLKSLS